MQNIYSQNKEDLFVLNYFGNFTGNLLDIGANDGETFSNSKLLIENGWSAVLVEPGTICKKLVALHNDNENVQVYNFGIGESEEIVTFYESGSHIAGGEDRGLVSTMDFEETKRWPDVKFESKEIRVKPFSALLKHAPFDFISIDAEGFDLAILRQIDLKGVGCSCLCIEWNGDKFAEKEITDYCNQFGLKLSLKNAENLVFTL